MTRWIRIALAGSAVALGLLLPAGAALASTSSVDPTGGVLTWQLPGND